MVGLVDEVSLTLFERLADRLCHDFASSAQAVASGFDLLREAQNPAEREEAEGFLAEAVATQRARIGYARRAYGPASTAVAASELELLVQALFANIRPNFDWQVTSAALEPAAGRSLLILAQLATDILAAGGLARLSERSEGQRQWVELDAEGPRAKLRDELRSGLTGTQSETGHGGRWAQGAFVRSLVVVAGGELGLEERPLGVRIWLNLPPGA